ncbi:hypothetical protein Rs2_19029 [Raphanus sativus]|nr:hypothetical protein Rs2_19029 [Raphanus sativus]
MLSFLRHSPLTPRIQPLPSLAATPPKSRAELRRSHLSPSSSDTVMTQADVSTNDVVIPEATTQFGSLAEIETLTTVPATVKPIVVPSTTSSSVPVEEPDITMTDSAQTVMRVNLPNQ